MNVSVNKYMNDLSHYLNILYPTVYTQEFSLTFTLLLIRIGSPSSLLTLRSSLLALLDVSAAFDTLNHGILLERLSTKDSLVWGIHGPTSVAEHRSFMLATANHAHPSSSIYSVHHGSVLEPVLYVIYTSEPAKLVESLGLCK